MEISKKRKAYLALYRQCESQIVEEKIVARGRKDVASQSRLDAAKAEGSIEAFELVLALLSDNLLQLGEVI